MNALLPTKEDKPAIVEFQLPSIECTKMKLFKWFSTIYSAKNDWMLQKK